MIAMAFQITSLTIVYSTVYSGTDEKKPQSPASLASERGIHRWSVNSPHKWPVTRKCFHLIMTSWFHRISTGLIAAEIFTFCQLVYFVLLFLHYMHTLSYISLSIWSMDSNFRPPHKGKGKIFPWQSWLFLLTYWGRDKMAAISQTTFSNAFSWMEMYEFRLLFQRSLFLGVKLPIFQHWFR